MKRYNDISLKSFHTFGVDLKAPCLIEIDSIDDIYQLKYDGVFQKSFYVLGGGSNVLFLNIPEVVLKINIKGIEIAKQNEENVWITVKAGEEWDAFVQYCVENNFGGVENLSLIPGTAGAAPVQNIGAYGMEIKDSLESLKAINLNDFTVKDFSNQECRFAYRNSFFKNKENRHWIILETTYKLTKYNHRFVLNYGNISSALNNRQITLQAIRDMVIQQRTSKLPDVKLLGNAGSFFKNPYISLSKFEELKAIFPSVPSFQADSNNIKIPAAWLIEQSGLKGFRMNNVGIYEKQPLVIVNYGNATTKEILDFSDFIIKTVKEKFDITLEREVNIV
ncbi:MAG: UDP-N-acetylmuramate dehydrogenase [Bacteroidales bacterium]|nr:UDP-N-acetylmuramate dehydrogenase [Bacteroidales bacterium]